MKVLLLGNSGQLGRSVARELLSSAFEVAVADRSVIDLEDGDAISEALSVIGPDVIVNCAAYTAVDKAETESADANKVNHLAVKELGFFCAARDAKLIHISTDYVFDGCSSAPYVETEETKPINVYGKTKLDGENAIREIDCDHIILRVSWLFSEFGENFVKTMLRIGREKKEINVVNDQFGSPTSAASVARVIKKICQKYESGQTIERGIYHFANSPWCSWYEFAQKIFESANQIGYEIDCAVRPLGTKEYSTAAPRPSFSVLNTSKIENALKVQKEGWEGAVKEVIRQVSAGAKD